MITFTVYRVPESECAELVSRLLRYRIWFAVQHEGDHFSLTIHSEDQIAAEEAFGDAYRDFYMSPSTTTNAPGVPVNSQLEAGTVWVEKSWDISDEILGIGADQLTPRHTWMPFAVNGFIFAWNCLTRRERAIIVQCTHHGASYQRS